MKGIILAGGHATRLKPATDVISKQLIPIYDKPMIYYPLSTLMLAGIRDILVISTKETLPLLENLLEDGSKWGMNFSYAEQSKPRGLPDAFIVGEEFIGKDSCSLVLGDNIFHAHGLQNILQSTVKNIKKNGGATIFSYKVSDPQRHGIVGLNSNNEPTSLEEKPKNPKSNYAILGLYFFDNEVSKIAKTLKPSKRGELEMIDLHKPYMKRGKLDVQIMGRGFTWFDTGTFDSMSEASEFVKVLQTRQNVCLCSPEEIAFGKGFIDRRQLRKLADKYPKSGYGRYLFSLLDN